MVKTKEAIFCLKKTGCMKGAGYLCQGQVLSQAEHGAAPAEGSRAQYRTCL